MCDEFASIREFIPVFVRRSRGKTLDVESGILLCALQHIVVRDKETVFSIRSDGVLHGTLPDHSAHTLALALILRERPDLLDSPYRDQYSCRAFDEWNVFGVEKTKRFLVMDVPRNHPR